MTSSRLQGAERLERRVKIGFAVVVTVLAVVGAAWYRGTTRYVDDSRWVHHTYDVIDALDDLLGAAKDAELGQRGYLLTSDSSYLRGYEGALRAVPPALARVRTLTSDNPVETARLPGLERVLAERLGLLDQIIALQRGRKPAAAIALVRTGAGKRAMDQVRRIVGAMHADESQLLAARSAAFHQSERSAFIVSAAAVVAGDRRRIRSARLALGGVAHKPWRLTAAEAALRGASLADIDALRSAIATSFTDARPLADNAFKVELAQRVAVRALQTAGARA